MNSSEMPWMRCLPTLWPVRQRRRVRPARAGAAASPGACCAQVAADAHDRAAGADAGDERVGRRARGIAAATRSPGPVVVAVRLDVVLVRELARQERARRRRRELLGQADAAEEAALLAADEADRRRRSCG